MYSYVNVESINFKITYACNTSKIGRLFKRLPQYEVIQSEEASFLCAPF